MITRCPECATAFRVSQAQLDARAGQVRCGHCGEIFDAVEFLESVDEAPAPSSEPETVADVAAQPPPPEPLPPEPLPPEPLPPEALQPEPPPPEPLPLESPPPEPSPPAHVLTEPQPEPEAPEPELDFGRPITRSRPSRFWWGLTAALLLVTLNAQALFYFRGPIALVWPEARPYIEALCEERCDIPLPKRAELMSIETSDLQAEPGAAGVMTLSATLRNRAAFPQAFPALELTLTNERDQPVARRVLKPSEYLGRTADDPIPSCAGGVASCEVQVRLFLEAAALKPSGYRLYLFYP